MRNLLILLVCFFVVYTTNAERQLLSKVQDGQPRQLAKVKVNVGGTKVVVTTQKPTMKPTMSPTVFTFPVTDSEAMNLLCGGESFEKNYTNYNANIQEEVFKLCTQTFRMIYIDNKAELAHIHTIMEVFFEKTFPKFFRQFEKNYEDFGYDCFKCSDDKKYRNMVDAVQSFELYQLSSVEELLKLMGVIKSMRREDVEDFTYEFDIYDFETFDKRVLFNRKIAHVLKRVVKNGYYVFPIFNIYVNIRLNKLSVLNFIRRTNIIDLDTTTMNLPGLIYSDEWSEALLVKMIGDATWTDIVLLSAQLYFENNFMNKGNNILFDSIHLKPIANVYQEYYRNIFGLDEFSGEDYENFHFEKTNRRLSERRMMKSSDASERKPRVLDINWMKDYTFYLPEFSFYNIDGVPSLNELMVSTSMYSSMDIVHFYSHMLGFDDLMYEYRTCDGVTGKCVYTGDLAKMYDDILEHCGFHCLKPFQIIDFYGGYDNVKFQEVLVGFDIENQLEYLKTVNDIFEYTTDSLDDNLFYRLLNPNNKELFFAHNISYTLNSVWKFDLEDVKKIPATANLHGITIGKGMNNPIMGFETSNIYIFNDRIHPFLQKNNPECSIMEAYASLYKSNQGLFMHEDVKYLYFENDGRDHMLKIILLRYYEKTIVDYTTKNSFMSTGALVSSAKNNMESAHLSLVYGLGPKVKSGLTTSLDILIWSLTTILQIAFTMGAGAIAGIFHKLVFLHKFTKLVRLGASIKNILGKAFLITDKITNFASYVQLYKDLTQDGKINIGVLAQYFAFAKLGGFLNKGIMKGIGKIYSTSSTVAQNVRKTVVKQVTQRTIQLKRAGTKVFNNAMPGRLSSGGVKGLSRSKTLGDGTKIIDETFNAAESSLLNKVRRRNDEQLNLDDIIVDELGDFGKDVADDVATKAANEASDKTYSEHMMELWQGAVDGFDVALGMGSDSILSIVDTSAIDQMFDLAVELVQTSSDEELDAFMASSSGFQYFDMKGLNSTDDYLNYFKEMNQEAGTMSNVLSNNLINLLMDTEIQFEDVVESKDLYQSVARDYDPYDQCMYKGQIRTKNGINYIVEKDKPLDKTFQEIIATAPHDQIQYVGKVSDFKGSSIISVTLNGTKHTCLSRVSARNDQPVFIRYEDSEDLYLLSVYGSQFFRPMHFKSALKFGHLKPVSDFLNLDDLDSLFGDVQYSIIDHLNTKNDKGEHTHMRDEDDMYLFRDEGKVITHSMLIAEMYAILKYSKFSISQSEDLRKITIGHMEESAIGNMVENNYEGMAYIVNSAQLSENKESFLKYYREQSIDITKYLKERPENKNLILPQFFGNVDHEFFRIPGINFKYKTLQEREMGIYYQLKNDLTEFRDKKVSQYNHPFTIYYGRTSDVSRVFCAYSEDSSDDNENYVIPVQHEIYNIFGMDEKVFDKYNTKRGHFMVTKEQSWKSVEFRKFQDILFDYAVFGVEKFTSAYIGYKNYKPTLCYKPDQCNPGYSCDMDVGICIPSTLNRCFMDDDCSSDQLCYQKPESNSNYLMGECIPAQIKSTKDCSDLGNQYRQWGETDNVRKLKNCFRPLNVECTEDSQCGGKVSCDTVNGVCNFY